jgi:hypothetical protein
MRGGCITYPSLHAVGVNRPESVKIEKKVLLAGRQETYQNIIFGKSLARKKLVSCTSEKLHFT